MSNKTDIRRHAASMHEAIRLGPPCAGAVAVHPMPTCCCLMPDHAQKRSSTSVPLSAWQPRQRRRQLLSPQRQAATASSDRGPLALPAVTWSRPKASTSSRSRSAASGFWASRYSVKASALAAERVAQRDEACVARRDAGAGPASRHAVEARSNGCRQGAA